MREAHAHVAAYGQSLSLPSLAACTSVAECLARVRELAAAGQPGAWVRLLGARVEAWDEPRWPTLAELDRAAPHRPCVIMSFDHHAAVASTAALRAAGLRPGDAPEPSGVVCADDRGEPTGLLLEGAAYKAWGAAPEPTPEESRAHVLAGLSALAALGFDEVDDLHSQDWLGPTLADLERSGELPLRRVNLYPSVTGLPAVFQTAHQWRSDRVVLAGGKLFADGTLNSRTAHTLAPYRTPAHGHPCGVPMASPDDLDDALRLCESLGLHLAVHAIGDGAVRSVLDAVERVRRERGPLPGGRPEPRHRVEHAELIDAADVPRFAALGVVCSVQPCHLLTDVEVLTRQLPHRLDRVLPLRELIDSGCAPAGPGHGGLLWFGSDAPIVRPDPADSLRAAVHRRREGDPDSAAIAPAQAITESEARACFGGPA